jgi:hypothetical protein
LPPPHPYCLVCTPPPSPNRPQGFRAHGLPARCTAPLQDRGPVLSPSHCTAPLDCPQVLPALYCPQHPKGSDPMAVQLGVLPHYKTEDPSFSSSHCTPPPPTPVCCLPCTALQTPKALTPWPASWAYCHTTRQTTSLPPPLTVLPPCTASSVPPHRSQRL